MSGVDLSSGLLEVLAALERAGLDTAEVYAKRGRSRRLVLAGRLATASSAQEEGWAVRAGNARGGFFHAASGAPSTGVSWPAASGAALRLPEPAPLGDWRAPADFDAPLLAESEARSLLEGIGRELAAELPGARLQQASLEEGTSESELASSRGMRVAWKSRAALLRLEAISAGPRRVRAAVDVAARLGHGFSPSALARRLADRLHVQQTGSAPERDRGEFLLAPPVGARLLLGLLPALVGAGAEARLRALQGRGARVGAEALSIVDDGRLPQGVLCAPVDGEGTPTRELTLISQGEARQPLLPWWTARPPQSRASGCVRRASYRDVPAVGPSQLYVRPRADVSVASLLGAVSRGYYLLDATGGGVFDWNADRFALPVCGFAVQGGRSSAPVAGAWLCGGIGALLRGVQGAARDLAFFPLDGMLGAPTLLVTGLELRGSAP